MEQWLAQFAAAKAQLPGANNATLDQERQQQLDKCREQGLPDRRDEAWKYTNLNGLANKEFAFASEATKATVTEADLAAFRFADQATHELVFINGVLDKALSDLDNLPEGLTISAVSDLMEQSGSLSMLPALPDSDNVFVSLNSAFTTDGALIEAKENAVINQPVHLIFINAETDQPIMQAPRMVINASMNSQLKVIESYVSMGEPKHFTNALTHIHARRNSQVEHYRIQDESVATYHIANLIIEQDADSRVVNHAVSLGSALARVDTHSILSANNAEVELNGLFMAQGRQHTDQQIRIDHSHPHTRSDQFYKGVLDNASRGVFNGKVVVHEDAQKIESAQVNKNLLLSPNAEVDTKPELEIYADDVKCAHGATIGQLDDKELFYLQSRGIDEEKARSILTYAFADEVIERMSLSSVQAFLEKRVVGQLADEKIADLKEIL